MRYPPDGYVFESSNVCVSPIYLIRQDVERIFYFLLLVEVERKLGEGVISRTQKYWSGFAGGF